MNLASSSDWEQVRELLALCMYPNEEKINRQAEMYQSDESLQLYGMMVQEELVGLIGISKHSYGEAVLQHIAVKQNHRGQGIGRSMINEFMKSNNITRLEAETDNDAVGFYRGVGFEITSLGEKYPGVERFLCILKRLK
ncbi:GNAT family N-acetyltransferase [Paenibacillus sp. chi10]|uniref:GNAT family N-acetyltransferase n=1 Tax=Paenibacillus suaedae TaxID=3077233 RepID=A0AAJ2N8A4_9BACL|nr:MULTISPECIES: GNAT family N-acetyltransferase [unclassified Paenibacillus]MDT8976259.1 GNAT family N-acetyltransferase [Paenibacillus sp. chi10]